MEDTIKTMCGGAFIARDAFQLSLSIISIMRPRCKFFTMILLLAKSGAFFVLQKRNYWCGLFCLDESIQRIGCRDSMCCGLMIQDVCFVTQVMKVSLIFSSPGIFHGRCGPFAG